ncbi:MAG TPA: peptidylprolyl isomerase [candidate division Zixibacteria bacterium]
MKRIALLGLLLVLMVFGLVGCAKRENKVVAKMENREITLGELENRFFTQMKMAAASGMDIPKQEDILEDMIKREVLIISAYKRDLDKDQKIDTLLKEREKSLLMDELFKVEILSKSKPTDSEVKSFYNKLKEKIRARHILVKTKTEAGSIYNQLKKGANFEQLAKEKSIDKQSGQQGGDLGFFSWGNMVEPFQKTAFALKKGEISKPVKTQFGWHIIKLEEREKAEPPDFQSNKEAYAQNLERMKQTELINQYLEGLKKRENFKVDSLTFNILLTKASQLDSTTGERRVVGGISVDIFTPQERQALLVQYRGGKMSLEDFALKFNLLPANSRMNGFGDREGLKELAYQMLLPDLLVEAARLRGIDKSKSYRKKFLDIKEAQMASKLVNEFILDTVKVTPEEVEKYYQEHKNLYFVPPQVHIQEILLGSKQEADEVLKKVKSGADFSRLAQEKTLRTYSKDKAGDLGYIQEAQFPELFKAGLKLRKGEVGGPIYSKESMLGEEYSIIKLLDKKEGKQTSFAEVREYVGETALREKQNKVLEDWIEKAKASMKLAVHKELLGVAKSDSVKTGS